MAFSPQVSSCVVDRARKASNKCDGWKAVVTERDNCRPATVVSVVGQRKASFCTLNCVLLHNTSPY